MSLEKTFRKVEKPAKEKKFKVITSLNAIVDDLIVYLEKNGHAERHFVSKQDYLNSCMNFLKSFELNPEIISEFNKKRRIMKGSDAFGLYLSAMIQTSYNQDHNNFVFEEVNAAFFGAFLQGQPEKPIKITIKELKRDYSLLHAKNCALTTENIVGNWSLYNAENSSLTAETIEGNNTLGYSNTCSLIVKTLNGRDSLSHAKNCKLKTKMLEGNYSFWDADHCTLSIEILEGYSSMVWAHNCLAEITKYQGTKFGYGMNNCTIKSGNKETLETIKKQTEGRYNKFQLKKIR